VRDGTEGRRQVMEILFVGIVVIALCMIDYRLNRIYKVLREIADGKKH
jgi:hypothetical protein